MTIKPFLYASGSALCALVGACYGGYLYLALHDGVNASKVLFIAAILSGFLYGESDNP